jgi:hypothetical protein
MSDAQETLPRISVFHMTGRFRWLPAQSERHAVPDTFPFWGDKTTLCELAVVVDHEPTKLEWCWPTCVTCESAWRKLVASVR